MYGEVYVLIVGAVWVGVCPHGGSSLGRCMSSLGAVWVGVCPHCGSSLGRCMPSLWEQFG